MAAIRDERRVIETLKYVKEEGEKERPATAGRGALAAGAKKENNGPAVGASLARVCARILNALLSPAALRPRFVRTHARGIV